MKVFPSWNRHDVARPLLAGLFKMSVYVNKTHTIEELQNNIRIKMNSFSDDMLQHVSLNMSRRKRLCKQKHERHFDHLF